MFLSRKTDGHAGEGAEEGAGGARLAQDRQQGVAAPEAAHAIVRAHLAEPYQWTAAVSFTVL